MNQLTNAFSERLIAAPVIRKAKRDMPAWGYTDFVNIYLANELNKNEYRTVLRHEQAHVWAGHNARGVEMRKDEAHVHKFWEIACEMEIARNIYDAQDLINIKAPRSRIRDIYLPDSFPKMPVDILIAEDIYQWFVDNPDESMHLRFQSGACKCEVDGEGNVKIDGQEVDKETAGKVLDAIRKHLDGQEKASQAQSNAENDIKALYKRRPSLTEAIDAALRVRVERERSYRRPSRRIGEGLELKGAISTPRPPLVEIFVDRSGSFSDEKTRKAEEKLKMLLARYGASIRYDVWFFGNDVVSPVNIAGGGNTPYHLISDHLLRTMPKLAVVITDDDPIYDTVKPVPGPSILCVPIGCGRTNLAAALGGKDVA